MTVRTLLFTDVVDSTRMVEQLGNARAAQVWLAHDLRARELLRRHRGREIDRTDGFFLLFDRTIEAARFAVDYHDALRELELSARVGIHVGSVILRENTSDDVARGAKPLEVEGLAKPLAARVMSLARGRQTLMTAAARDALDEAPPDGSETRRHGHYRLKGVEEPVEIFELGVCNASPFMPPADADKAYRVVRSGDLWSPVREVRHNLPIERDAFVGRTAQLRALANCLDAGSRLITVLGPAGMGKTRFVKRYAWTWLGDWPGGVYFCDLSEAGSLDGIHVAVGAALGVALGRDDSGVQLGNAIAGRGRCLVILDNFEQVVLHAPATVGRWLDRAPEAALVVTSRERLHLAGEDVVAVEPMSVEHEGIELFAARARVQRPGFAVNDSNHAAVADVVRLLDGLPLAIELAAARVGILSLAQLLSRMRDRFALLAAARGPASRQATLRAAIDWSWELLTPWEQGALAQCSIFDGGFTLEAAEAVLELSRWPQAPSPIDVVQALFDKSLLRTWTPSGQERSDIDEMHFGMYLSIREYAADKLAQDESAARGAEQRHGRYYAGFGTDEAIEALSRHGGVRLRRMLAIELDNLVGACRRAVKRGDVDVAVEVYRATWEVLELSGPAVLGTTLGAEVLAMDGLDPSSRALALAVHAISLRRTGQADGASTALEAALAHFRAIGDAPHESNVLVSLGNLRRDQGRADEARECLEAAHTITAKTGNRRLEGYLLGNLGILHAEKGQLDDARALFARAIAIHREVGNRRIEGIDTCNLGIACLESGSFDEAGAHLNRSLAIHREGGARRDEAVTLVNLGLLHASQGRRRESRPIYEAALTILREVGDLIQEAHASNALANVLRDEGRVSEGLVHCERALVISRAVGNRRIEGGSLATQGELLMALSRLAQAREALLAGEAILGDAGDQLGLANLMCNRVRVELAAGDSLAAQAALAAAERALAQTSAGTDSDVARQIASLRASVS